MIITTQVRAELVLGSSFSSVTAGRTSPSIYGGYDSNSFALTFASVGVKNSVYYHSGYLLSGFWQFDAGAYLWGNVRAGIGGGVHFAKRGYTDGTTNECTTDVAIGPAIRATWEIFPYGFIGVEGLYGFGLNNLLLVFQSVNSIIFGVRF
jgi:hypothetical protein